MVAEYNKAKDTLDAMVEGTPEYTKQKKTAIGCLQALNSS